MRNTADAPPEEFPNRELVYPKDGGDLRFLEIEASNIISLPLGGGLILNSQIYLPQKEGTGY